MFCLLINKHYDCLSESDHYSDLWIRFWILCSDMIRLFWFDLSSELFLIYSVCMSVCMYMVSHLSVRGCLNVSFTAPGPGSVIRALHCIVHRVPRVVRAGICLIWSDTT